MIRYAQRGEWPTDLLESATLRRHYLEMQFAPFCWAPFLGLMCGVTSSNFNGHRRHPLGLASFWASIAATIAMPFILASGVTFAYAVVLVFVWLTVGGVYGLVLGMTSRLLRYWMDRRKR